MPSLIANGHILCVFHTYCGARKRIASAVNHTAFDNARTAAVIITLSFGAADNNVSFLFSISCLQPMTVNNAFDDLQCCLVFGRKRYLEANITIVKLNFAAR